MKVIGQFHIIMCPMTIMICSFIICFKSFIFIFRVTLLLFSNHQISRTEACLFAVRGSLCVSFMRRTCTKHIDPSVTQSMLICELLTL